MLPFYKNNCLEVGVDEAGRGPLIGDVYAAAVIWPPDIGQEKDAMTLNDSKKITKRRRLILKDYIEENAIDFSISSVDNKTIDDVNILNASITAMHKAIAGLNVIAEHIIVDGNIFRPYYNDNNVIPYTCIPQGDGIYDSIAAASILAKVYHDEHIKDLCDKDSELDKKYKILKNMGYGTKDHINGIKEYGITKYHRKTFKPCSLYAIELNKKNQ